MKQYISLQKLTKYMTLACVLLGSFTNTKLSAFISCDSLRFCQPNDFRYIYYITLFPLITHYLNGGDSTRWADARITRMLSIQDCPQAIQDLLHQRRITIVQCFEAYCKPLYPLCNYFVHTVFMPRMTENVAITAEVGMYNANNLNSPYNEVGVNAVIPQRFSFHDSRYLSGNVARFVIVNPTQPADAWFVAICNRRAIVVHWFFIPSGNNTLISQQRWNGEPIHPTLYPLFSDQWNNHFSFPRNEHSLLDDGASQPENIQFFSSPNYENINYTSILEQLIPFMDSDQVKNSNPEQIQSIIFDLANSNLKNKVLGNFKAWIKDNPQHVSDIVKSQLLDPSSSMIIPNSSNSIPLSVMQLLQKFMPTDIDEFAETLMNHGKDYMEEITWVFDHTEEIQNWISNHSIQ